jgi:hypothetical protein
MSSWLRLPLQAPGWQPQHFNMICANIQQLTVDDLVCVEVMTAGTDRLRRAQIAFHQCDAADGIGVFAPDPGTLTAGVKN